MSTQLGSQVHIRNCDECSKAFKTVDSPREYHCSHECYYLDKGQGALNQLKSDHKICATCFRYIKSVHAPKQSWLEKKADRVDTAIQHGGEYVKGPNGQLTLDATECSNSRHTSTESIIGYQYETPHTDHLYGESGKWICECGNVETYARDDVLEQLDLDTTKELLIQRLFDLYDKGAIQERITPDVFYEAFSSEDMNWRYAIGKALHS